MRTPANRMLGITVAAIAVIAIAVAILSAAKSPAELDPSSPEGVVQQYLTAVFDHRNDDAADFLDPAGNCAADDLDRFGVAPNARVDLVKAESTTDSARVTIAIEYSSGDPFGGGWSEEKTLRLVKSDGAWKLTGIPWPMYDCGAESVK